MSTLFAWVNGEVLPSSEARISINDLGLLRGYAVFDYLRIHNGKPFRLTDHIARLRRSCGDMGIPLLLSDEEFEDIIRSLQGKSGTSDAAVRIVVTGGVGVDSVTMGDPTVIIAIENPPDYPAWMYDQGVSLITHQFKREPASTKTTNYLTALRLKERMSAASADDVLYCDGDRVLELTRNNLCCFVSEELITPMEDVLPGITRKVVMQLAKARFEVTERVVRLQEVMTCDEAFLCGTGKRIMPIISIDSKRIGAGVKGERTAWVMKRFEEVVLEETGAS